MTTRIFAILALAAVLGTTEFAMALSAPCTQIKTACLNAGFVQDGNKGGKGKGLWVDCVNPIIQGTTAKKATIPLPTVDAATISSCKQSNAKFGAGKLGS